MDLSVLLNEDISEENILQLIDEMKITSMNPRDIINHILSKGWEHEREGAEHTIFKHKDAIHKIQVPRHNNISIGVVRKIIKQSDPAWKDPNLSHLYDSCNYKNNKDRIIKEALKTGIEKNKKKIADSDKFIPNPELKSDITKT